MKWAMLPLKMTRRFISLKNVAVLLIVGASLLLTTNAFGMFKVCLFSPVKGKVVLNGQPVVGAVIERSYDWAWKNQKGRDETTTDQNGEFSLPAIYGTMILGSVMPHEPVIDQTINIQYQGKTHEAWYAHKHDYAENGELTYSENGKLTNRKLDVLCELSDTPQRHEEGILGYFGIAQLR
jgi:hypothetical protein